MLAKSQRLGLALLIALGLLTFGLSLPEGPVLDYSSTQNYTPRPALMLNTSGGTVTIMRLNATSQNLGWKAYVGNISGRLVLADMDNFSVFAWELNTMSGELFATRHSGSISWGNIACANSTQVASEDTALHKNTSSIDSISNTFSGIAHSPFYVGTKSFGAGSCGFSIATYVGGMPQSSAFQIVLLHDGYNLVYASLLESATTGYNNRKYDFQIIVAEDSTTQSNTPYYFYVELG